MRLLPDWKLPAEHIVTSYISRKLKTYATNNYQFHAWHNHQVYISIYLNNKNTDILENVTKPTYKYHFTRKDLHVLTNSDFLFNNWLLSNYLIINSFSVRHNLQQSILAAHLTTAAISHEILGVMFKSFNCQMYLDNSVLFLYLA